MRLQGKDFLVSAEFSKEEVMKITGTVPEEDMRVREAEDEGLDIIFEKSCLKTEKVFVCKCHIFETNNL